MPSWSGAWPYLHASVTIAALEAGKHVLTEARMAATGGGRPSHAARLAGSAEPRRDGRAVVLLAVGRRNDSPAPRSASDRSRPACAGRLGFERAGRSGRGLALAAPIQRRERDGPRHPVYEAMARWLGQRDGRHRGLQVRAAAPPGSRRPGRGRRPRPRPGDPGVPGRCDGDDRDVGTHRAAGVQRRHLLRDRAAACGSTSRSNGSVAQRPVATGRRNRSATRIAPAGPRRSTSSPRSAEIARSP